MSEKHWTPEEANELLPYLAPTLVELREKFEDAVKIREQVAVAAASNGGSHERDDWSHTLARVGELIDRLRDWGIELRDVNQGLVDFPALIEGEEAFLCWRLGENEVGFWHPPETGIAGRRPL